MPDETAEQKEAKELQTKILNLEGELREAKKHASESSEKLKKADDLSKELEAIRKERDELKAKYWDKTERRAKERRLKLKENGKVPFERDVDDDAMGGPYG